MTLLEEVVTLGGLALQAEDCLIRAAVHHRGEHGGLALMQNERYYQFIVWKALLPKWHVELEKGYRDELEKGYRDMIILADGVKHHFEMKYWRHETTDELKGDISKLRSITNGGYFLVFFANPVGPLTKENLKMVGELPGIGAPPSYYCFRTENDQGERFVFSVGGWPVPSSSSVAHTQ